MRTHTKLLLAAIAASLALASAVSTASAGRISVSETRFSQIWRPILFFTGDGVTIHCDMTLEGSFHYRSIAKVARSLIGYVTKAVIQHVGDVCAEGDAFTLNGVEVALRVTLANTLPWHITYEGFEGTLPGMTGIRVLIRPSFVLNELLTTLCLYSGNLQAVIKRDAGGRATQIIPDESIAATKVSGGILCTSVRWEYTRGETTQNIFLNLAQSASITVTLI